MLKQLSARDALMIAAQYGFSIRASNWERDMIRSGIVEARNAQRDVHKSSVQYFDEYLARMAADIRKDSKTYGVPIGRLGLIG